MAHAPPRPFCELLMILFGAVKWTGLIDRRNYGSIVTDGHFLSDTLGNSFLLVGYDEYGRTVLVADIRALPVQLRRVMQPEEMPAQVFKTDDTAIELHMHSFSMAGVLITDILICRVIQRTADVPYGGNFDARNLVEVELYSPKTSCCKNRLFHT